ncbi:MULTISPECIES: protein YgfX [unclassified Paludibacterium]|uniref:protein YgfX n=1 Tax=unclassified Paludibacterium TaxID=2618429 RepID=UPI001C04C7A9|nr:protein YgfX [Paludibacterium sp. B53371]BEV71266.1 hypothetical protein THUN1379_07480 [Paludibacterium sp. THUN1379]
MTPYTVACASAADFRVALRPSLAWRVLLALCALILLFAWPGTVSVWWLLLLPWPLWRLWQLGEGPVALAVRDGRQLSVRQGADWVPVQPGADSVVLPWLIILHYTLAGRRYHCVLLADSAAADALRRLRVFLRWHPAVPLHQVSRS